MIKFEKVSYEQFYKDLKSAMGKSKLSIETPIGYNEDTDFDKFCKDAYDKIKLPERATKGSAGYDFYSPVTINMSSKHEVIIPTGIRCIMPENVVLMTYPRSGLGFKYGVSLKNTVGVIDSDYQYSDNEGHIMSKLCIKNNDEFETTFGVFLGNTITIDQGKGFMQGIFMNYLTTDDDATSESRNGGFGSTDK